MREPQTSCTVKSAYANLLLNLDDAKQAYTPMIYDAVTIDTNIFRQHGWNLESGMLSQLVQFKEGNVQVVLSEIVVREIHKHLRLEANKSRKAIEDVRRLPLRNGLITPDISERLNTLLDDAVSSDDAAKNRLQNFIDNTELTIISVEHATVKELVKCYFAPSAPFQSSGAKKSEFPDAIALLSLEAWAKSSERKILAISNDTGWAEFADHSDLINVESDFAGALQSLQLHAEKTKEVVTRLLAKLGAGKFPDLAEDISDEVAKAVGELNVHAEAHSPYSHDSDWVTIQFKDCKLPEFRDQSDFTLVRIGRKTVVAQLDIVIRAEAVTEFLFSIRDSIDGGYISLGSCTAETEVEFVATTLVTLESDFSIDNALPQLSELEIIDAIDAVDFGTVDIDYDHEDQYYFGE